MLKIIKKYINIIEAFHQIKISNKTKVKFHRIKIIVHSKLSIKFKDILHFQNLIDIVLKVNKTIIKMKFKQMKKISQYKRVYLF
jgi:hypothetical protein